MKEGEEFFSVSWSYFKTDSLSQDDTFVAVGGKNGQVLPVVNLPNFSFGILGSFTLCLRQPHPVISN